jgi:RecG-like helicase
MKWSNASNPKSRQDVKVYWVCPLVEESELLDLAAASERFDILQQHFGDKVGLIHGRMKPQDKDDVMQKFITGNTRLLVATTVIEVGVDVPDATIMVIEHAERFGLAQLHQLRGRVGTRRKTFVLFLDVCPAAWENRTGASRNSAENRRRFPDC